MLDYSKKKLVKNVKLQNHHGLKVKYNDIDNSHDKKSFYKIDNHYKVLAAKAKFNS